MNETVASNRSAALENIRMMLAAPTGGLARASDESRTGNFAATRMDGTRVHGGLKFLSAGQAYAIVKKGVPSRTLAPLGEYLGLTKGAVAAYLDMDRATAMRKIARDEMLPTHAAESMLRLLELDGLAEDTFETPEEAAAWLRKPHPMLEGESPLECAKSGFGAQRVKDILVAIRYGGVV